ncbi:hypothetical protein IPH92_02035 [Candidatus Kaiserbacteria bacterium]|nr:MAG: hypothetical protein IPH92_02035 [Candidatus Kaiserbacteria bacterium]
MNYLLPQIEGVIAKISKSSALYPLLIGLVFAVAVVCIVFTLSENSWLRFFSLLFPTIVLIMIVRSYEHFAKNNPDMLRSETHVIQKQALSLIGDETHTLGTKATHVLAILNPNKPIVDEDLLELSPISEVQLSEPIKLV